MSSPLLIHVGYHKTATTWMQRHLFTLPHGYHQVVDHSEVFRHIVQPHGLTFTPTSMRKLLAERLTEVPSDATPVISSEILSGNPFYGGQGSDANAKRIKEIAPDARILISIRAQKRILTSIYMQYLLRGGTMRCDQFFSGTSEPGYHAFDPVHFEYDRLVALYQKLFTPENVLIVTQEALKLDMDKVAQEIADFSSNHCFTNLEPSAREVQSPSYPEYAVPILRRLNHVQKSILNPAPALSIGSDRVLYRAAGYLMRRSPLATWLKHHKPVTDFVREKFRGHYALSNRQLKSLSSRLDLSEYDY